MESGGSEVDDDVEMVEEGDLEPQQDKDQDLDLTPQRKKGRRSKKDKQKQRQEKTSKKYQVTWESDPLFKGWVAAAKNDPFSAVCKCCGVTFKAGRSELMKHGSGEKHKKKLKVLQGLPTIGEAFAKGQKTASNALKENAKKAEIMISAAFAEHNIAIHIVDHILEVMRNALPDSDILRHSTLGRTKCTAIIENVIAKTETEELVNELQETYFSVLIDGSTGNSAAKSMIVLVRYYSTKDKKCHVDSLELVQLDARDCSAASQYAALKKCFTVRTGHSLTDVHWCSLQLLVSNTTNLFLVAGRKCPHGPHTWVWVRQ